jgi:hypothetical protein
MRFRRAECPGAPTLKTTAWACTMTTRRLMRAADVVTGRARSEMLHCRNMFAYVLGPRRRECSFAASPVSL